MKIVHAQINSTNNDIRRCLALDLDDSSEQRFGCGGQLGAIIEITGLTNGFSRGGVRMNHIGETTEARPGLHGQRDFANHVASVVSDNGSTQNLVCFGVHADAHHTHCLIVGNGAIVVGEMLFKNAKLNAFGLQVGVRVGCLGWFACSMARGMAADPCPFRE